VSAAEYTSELSLSLIILMSHEVCYWFLTDSFLNSLNLISFSFNQVIMCAVNLNGHDWLTARVGRTFNKSTLRHFKTAFLVLADDLIRPSSFCLAFISSSES